MNKEFLFEMLETPSVSGNEYQLQEKIIEHMKPYCDKIITDHAGDVISVINPEAEIKVLLVAHADEIGLVISSILEDGRCRLKEVGSIRPALYAGQKVQVITEKGIVYGVIGQSSRLFNNKIEDKDLLLDIGVFNKEDAKKIVNIGDYIVHDSSYRVLNDRILSARALDDKIGIFSILEALKKSKKINNEIGVYAATTVGEETTKNGATFVSELVKPAMAIVIDVTYDTSLEGFVENKEYAKLGEGPVLSIGTIMNRKLEKKVRKAADILNIHLQYANEVYRTYTDSDKVHFSGTGIPTTLISIPLRYMHSPAELCDLKDVEDVTNLIVEVIESLKEDSNFNPFSK